MTIQDFINYCKDFNISLDAEIVLCSNENKEIDFTVGNIKKDDKLKKCFYLW